MLKASKLTIAAATAMTLAAGGAALQANADDTQHTMAGNGPRTLTLSFPWDDHGKTRYIDLGKKGEGPGDLFLTSGVPVRDERTGPQVSEIEQIEVILSRAHNGTVFQSGSLNLRDGSIQGAGIIRHTDAEQAESLTGGTGAYANTRGQMTVRVRTSRSKVNNPHREATSANRLLSHRVLTTLVPLRRNRYRSTAARL